MSTIEEAMAGFANNATPLTDESVNDIISNFTEAMPDETPEEENEDDEDAENDVEEIDDDNADAVIRSLLSAYSYVLAYPDTEEISVPVTVTVINRNGTVLKFENIDSNNLYRFRSLLEEHASDMPGQHREAGLPIYTISEFGDDVQVRTVDVTPEEVTMEEVSQSLDAGSPIVNVVDVRSRPIADNFMVVIPPTETESGSDHDADAERLKVEAEKREAMKIPVNSATVSIRESSIRFSSAVWFEAIQNKVVVLAGVGGIGSYVAYLLARLGIRSLFMYDDDVVEMSNMAGQLYRRSDIAKFKTDAMADIISQFTTFASANSITEKFENNSEAADIMICGFDNMLARRTFFDKWRRHVYDSKNRENCLFIDGRLSAEYLQVYCITGEDDALIEEYRKVALFEDSEAEQEVCSYKQTSFIANMIGSIIVNLFVNFVANQCGDMRSLPYFTEYNAETMLLNLRS